MISGEIFDILKFIVKFSWLIKLLILSFIYGSIIYSLIIFILSLSRNSKLKEKLTKGASVWLSIIVFTGAIILIYSYSHWGNRGSLSEQILPLKHYKKVTKINDKYIYIKANNCLYTHEYPLEEFSYNNDYLIGTLDSYFIFTKNEYILWDLKRDCITEYQSKQLLEEELKNKSIYYLIDNEDTFHSFYNNYWGNWNELKFWIKL